MKRFLIAMLCAAPLVGAPTAYESAQPVSAPECVFCPSMGCVNQDCADPTHYHACYADCTDPAHYHDCPVGGGVGYMGCGMTGCTDPTHPHCGQYWEQAPAAECVFCPSMGCARQDCTDPTHYHACYADCTDPAHYHNCPVGCGDTSHGHGGYHHGGGRGHHRGRCN